MNKRLARGLVTTVAAGLAALLLAGGCSKGDSPAANQQLSGGYSKAVAGRSPINGTLQENDAGAVTVAAQWMGQKEGSLVFGISMNTHSVPLDGYDLSTMAVLMDDEGKEYAPASWLSDPGGHHRSGTLGFPIPDSLKQGRTRYIKLIVRGIAGVEQRVFEWDL